MAKRILSVGNCGFDHNTIDRMIAQPFGAQLDAASTATEATAKAVASAYDLILVNRVFDADGDSGIEWIRSLKQNSAMSQVPIMLISNYPQYQTEAEQAGAVPGFGKRDLQTPELRGQLSAYLQ
jgi:two-component system, chemotaxis family, chemotaxis protein CheY